MRNFSATCVRAEQGRAALNEASPRPRAGLQSPATARGRLRLSSSARKRGMFVSPSPTRSATRQPAGAKLLANTNQPPRNTSARAAFSCSCVLATFIFPKDRCEQQLSLLKVGSLPEKTAWPFGIVRFLGKLA
jgi:hypothetical protein